MTYQLKVIKDYPIGFWTLDETSGTAATDKSGCGNNGTYTGGITNNLLPLIKGGIQGTLITNTAYVTFPVTKDYSLVNTGVSLARSGFSDNDFSLEVWVYPNITTTAITPLFADTSNNIGIYWEAGTIVFRLQNEYLYHTPTYIKKAFHIVATYTVSSMSLYVDGKMVSSKELTGFAFTNSSLTLSCGPTTTSANSFIVDAPAVYRYALSGYKILGHFFDSFSTPPIQVVKPDAGIYFGLSDQGIKSHFKYGYPTFKPWTAFVTSEINYNQEDNSISLIRDSAGGAKTVEFTDYITVPPQLSLTTSKVEWDGDNGVSVSTSIDGTTYIQCVNGKSIPQYKNGSFDSTSKLYIKFVLSSSDISKHIPKLKNLTFSFFQNKEFVGYNTGSKVVYSQQEYHLGSAVYDILSRDSKNGLRCDTDGGFMINTNKDIRTIEFFYTPSGFTDSGLVSSTSTNGYTASNYSWRNSGTVSKSNVSAIYVNGVNKTAETNISNVFKDDQLHHVVIVYGSNISGDITFNYSLYGATQSLYQNIGMYETAFNQSKVSEHLSLYTSSSVQTSSDSTFTVTESEVKYYDNDWIVVQSV